ncbi:MAG: PD40 domain-containing protein [Verrucomicrobia bacterium]|nr:PD40 domain-containing protein [Verrucomicrobiota bacterium]
MKLTPSLPIPTPTVKPPADRGGGAVASARGARLRPPGFPGGGRVRKGRGTVRAGGWWRGGVGAWVVLAAPALWAQTELDITKSVDVHGFLKPVPVHVSGFTGEADSVLKNDLLFMGIAHVPAAEAKFVVTGSNAGRVEGRVVEKFNQHQRLAKAYAGGTIRAQVHAFADDVARELTGQPGIAQTSIAFRVETGGGRSEIYVSDYDGHNARQVTRDESMAAAPAWGGRSMLYYDSYKLGRLNVFAHELASGSRRSITPYGGSSMSPAVSPNGQRVAMILSKSGNPDLYVADRNGANPQRLTSTREAESSPCWSPDGASICFVSRTRGPAGLYVVPAAGGPMRRLTTAGVPNATEPDWSPDGKWIVFTTMMRQFHICVVKAGGGEARVVVEGEDPSWAPNSRAVVFCRGPDHGKSLSLLDVPTAKVKTMRRFLGSNSQPSWAR